MTVSWAAPAGRAVADGGELAEGLGAGLGEGLGCCGLGDGETLGEALGDGLKAGEAPKDGELLYDCALEGNGEL